MNRFNVISLFCVYWLAGKVGVILGYAIDTSRMMAVKYFLYKTILNVLLKLNALYFKCIVLWFKIKYF